MHHAAIRQSRVAGLDFDRRIDRKKENRRQSVSDSVPSMVRYVLCII
jgi:hypothetical protein